MRSGSPPGGREIFLFFFVKFVYIVKEDVKMVGAKVKEV